MSKTRVGIINVTGYAGVELARLLYRHPQVALVSVTGRSAAGQKLGDVFPHLSRLELNIEPKLDEVDLAFSAMPHKDSAQEVLPLAVAGRIAALVGKDVYLIGGVSLAFESSGDDGAAGRSGEQGVTLVVVAAWFELYA